jgi:1-deoxy-D-xylulose-5-phosphate reductoisomerase
VAVRRRAQRGRRLARAGADAGRAAVGAGLALANKESLVAGGPLVRAVARPGQIVPVDSEHTALAQCLRSGTMAEVRRLILTASGGPFRGKDRSELTAVTPDQALAHPTWNMGPVVTINSATLVNKGLEVIEAHELFGVDYDDIEVVVHPTSVIHSMVEFRDGSTIVQASPPDMRLPIAAGAGLAGPGARRGRGGGTGRRRTPGPWRPWTTTRSRRCAGQGGRTGGRCRPAIYNAANEECVAGSRTGRLPFLGIVDTVARVLERRPISPNQVPSMTYSRRSLRPNPCPPADRGRGRMSTAQV